MSRDIRSFFAPVKSKTGGIDSTKTLSKDVKRNKNQKRQYVNESDSDSDIISTPPQSKKKKETEKLKENNVVSSKLEVASKPVKPVDLSSIFGSEPVQQKPQERKGKEKTDKNVKETEIRKKKMTKSKRKSGSNLKWLDSSSDTELEMSMLEVVTDIEMGATTSGDSKLNQSRDSPREKTDESISLPKPKENIDKVTIGKTRSSPVKTPIISEKKVTVISKTPQKAEIRSPSNSKASTTPTRSNSKAETSSRNNKTPRSCDTKLKTPKQRENLMDTSDHESKKITPTKSDLTPSKFSDDSRTPTPNKKLDPDLRRKQNAEAYQKYLQRGGPRNPGSKIIPKGNTTCLSGKTFVISGVLESSTREEVTDLITRCGGRVTSSISKKTSYIVLGDEPGQSKLEKANKFGTTKLSEDELFDIVREKSGDTIEHDESQESVICETPEKKIKEVHPDVFYCNENKKLRSEDGQTSSGIGSSLPSSISSCLLSSPVRESPVREVPVTHNMGDTLWVDKYKPKSTKQIIGQSGDRSCVKKLIFWLQNWFSFHSNSSKKKPVRPGPWSQNDNGSYFKAALLSGPPGVGKTTSVHLVCSELSYDVIEFNASDTRSKKQLNEQVSELLSSKNIKGLFNKGSSTSPGKHVLVMDEVDGMAGNEDRGGVQELIQLIKNSQIPVVCMCNDRSHPKIRSLSNYCYDLKFPKPRLEQIKGAMLSVCFKENIQIPSDALSDLITNSNHDIRQVLHNLSLWAAGDRVLTSEAMKLNSEKAKKILKLGPWDVARQVFSSSDHEKMTIHDKCDLFFQDYSLGPLFVQDLYLRCKPYRAKNDKKKVLLLMSEAADSITLGDVVERNIRSNNAWSLLPIQAIFSSVIPGYKMEGHVQGQIQFPVWLGKNSRRNRMDRLLQELQVHMRLNITGSKRSVNLDYLSHLSTTITKPLVQHGLGGVPDSLQVLHNYNLLREDVDSIVELNQWPGRPDIMSSIEPKVKAALTRAYNKEGKVTPYATVVAVKKNNKNSEESEEYLVEGGDDNEGVITSDNEEDNIEFDGMIKKVKAKTNKPSKKSQDEPTSSTSQSRSKSKSSKRKIK